jgi:hypothetical protein
MAGLNMKKIIPTFIPLLFEIFSHMRRDSAHNNNIKKFDHTEEKLSTIENLLIKQDKKEMLVRDEFKKAVLRIQIWLVLNSALLIAILVKLFFFDT